LVALSRRLAEHHMHLQVHFDPGLIDDLSPWLKRSAVPVVIDHMARVDATQGIQDHAFQALCRLLDNKGFHVKVSGIDRVNEKLPLKSSIASTPQLQFTLHDTRYRTDAKQGGSDLDGYQSLSIAVSFLGSSPSVSDMANRSSVRV